MLSISLAVFGNLLIKLLGVSILVLLSNPSGVSLNEIYELKGFGIDDTLQLSTLDLSPQTDKNYCSP